MQKMMNDKKNGLSQNGTLPARKKWLRFMAGYLTVMALSLFVWPEIAYAGGASAVTSSFNTLKDIVVALVTSVGTIVLLWGFFEWGTSLQSQEGVMQANAFKRIGGGLVMVLAPQLISAFVSS